MATFEASTSFTGPRDGMEFKLGNQGLGYYTTGSIEGSLEVATPLKLEEPRDFSVGMRVLSEDGYFATVKFVGPVATAKKAATTYIGVEWDEPGRGKHDGTVDGKEYFKTIYPKAGSLVKPNKLQRGITFPEALAQAEHPPSTPIHSILKNGGVDRAGSAPPLPEEANIAFINLEDNLISTFEDAFSIAARCPSLQILRIGKNIFNPVLGSPLPVLNALHSLTITMCRLGDWKLIETLSASLPNLAELSLAGNPDLLGNNQLASSGKVVFPELKVLEMSNTGIDNWVQVESLLSSSPQLTSLTLTKNKLRTLGEAPLEGSPLKICDNLLELTLDSNLVTDWNELHKINTQFPNLKGFGFVQNPCASGLDRRRLDRSVIPIMSKIEVLDGRPISDTMRLEAEQQFLVAALRGCVAQASLSLQPPSEPAVHSSDTLPSEPPASLEGASLSESQGGMPPRIPTLEEFVEMPGAKQALDVVLQQQFPHFETLGQKHGYPPQYQKLM